MRVDGTPEARLSALVEHLQETTHLQYLIRDNGTVIVQKSIDMGSPVIHASFNYRVNGEHMCDSLVFSLLSSLLGFGFLAGQEITDEGVANLGLQDRAYIRDLLIGNLNLTPFFLPQNVRH